MNQQNISKAPDLLVKRKRGRPRKDESVSRNVKQHTQPPVAMAAPPPPLPLPAAIYPPTSNVNTSNVNKVDPNMVGQAVTCVIDGIFDNGYLLSACVGPNNSILRGIVFQQGHVVPITPVNDVAPHVEMCQRGEFPILPLNPKSSMQVSQICEKQPAAQPVALQNYENNPAMVTGGSSTSLPQEGLRLIEQDELMQVFEVSKTVERSKDFDERAKNEHVVSDPTAEIFHASDAINDKSTGLEPVVNASLTEQPVKEPNGEKPEVVMPVDTVVENQASMMSQGLQQEIQGQTGEMRNIDAGQDQNREIAVDLSLSNFPEI